MIINGITIGTGPGEASYIFVTTDTTLAAGLRQVMNEIYIIATYTISSYDTTYTIASETFYNNALLNIFQVIWIDGILNVEGDLLVG